MRSPLSLLLLLIAAAGAGAHDAIKATGTLAGKKVQFPAKSVPEGVKATIALLESCHSAGAVPYSDADLKKAREGNHVRLVFSKPIAVFGGKVEVSEVVFTQPPSTGVFWLRSGNNVLRYSKFEGQKLQPFDMWLKQAHPAD